MGNKPVIVAVKVLPSYALSIKFTPPDDLTDIGGSITSYTVTCTPSPGSTVTVTNLQPFEHGGYSYLRRVHRFDQLGGTVYYIVVTAVGPAGSSASDAVEVTIRITNSYPALIRQRILEVLEAAAMQIEWPMGSTDRDVHLHQDEWGQARSFRTSKPFGGEFPVIAIGISGTSASEVQSVQIHMDTIEVPIEIRDAQQDDEEGCDVINHLQELIRAKLDLSGTFGLGNVCLVRTGPRYTFDGLDYVDQKSKVYGQTITVRVEATQHTGESIPVY